MGVVLLGVSSSVISAENSSSLDSSLRTKPGRPQTQQRKKSQRKAKVVFLSDESSEDGMIHPPNRSAACVGSSSGACLAVDSFFLAMSSSLCSSADFHSVPCACVFVCVFVCVCAHVCACARAHVFTLRSILPHLYDSAFVPIIL